MKGKTKRIVALLLVITLVFSLAACKKSDDAVTTTSAATTVADETTTAEETTIPDDTTALPSETTAEATTLAGETTAAVTTVAGETTTVPPTTTTKPATSIKAPVGGSISQIVAFYNQYANATKAYKGTIKVAKTSGTISVVNYVKFSTIVKPIAEKMLPNDYAKEADKTFKNGKEVGGTSTLVKHLPRDKDAKMSVLEAAGVKSATCIKSGSGWKVFITLKSETVNSLNAIPKYHSQCMDTLSMTDEDLAPFTLLKASVTYTDGTTINAVVNKNGLLDSVNILEPAQIKGDLTYPPLNFQLKDTDVTGNFKDEYVFTYLA